MEALRELRRRVEHIRAAGALIRTKDAEIARLTAANASEHFQEVYLLHEVKFLRRVLLALCRRTHSTVVL